MNLSIAESIRIADRLISMNPKQLTTIFSQGKPSTRNLNGLERRVLGALVSTAQGKDMKPDDIQESSQPSVRQVLNEVSAPSYSVANAVASLIRKMNFRV